MIHIESKDNALFKETKKLKDKKNRNKVLRYIIEGFRLVEEAFKAKLSISYILVLQEELDTLNKYLNKYELKDIKIVTISKALFKDLSSTENPQGIIAVTSMKIKSLNLEGEFYLLCDKLQDPGNIGTIIRTAHAAGVDGIILTKGTVDIFNEKVLRSTMGSIFYIPVVYDDNNYSIIKSFIKSGFSLVTTSLEAEKDFFKEDLKGKIILSVGNEGNGVSKEILDLSNKKVRIPMPGGAESLNVSIATSIILYEKVRQNQLQL